MERGRHVPVVEADRWSYLRWFPGKIGPSQSNGSVDLIQLLEPVLIIVVFDFFCFVQRQCQPHLTEAAKTSVEGICTKMNNMSVENAKKIRDKHNELLKENGLAGKQTKKIQKKKFNISIAIIINRWYIMKLWNWVRQPGDYRLLNPDGQFIVDSRPVEFEIGARSRCDWVRQPGEIFRCWTPMANCFCFLLELLELKKGKGFIIDSRPVEFDGIWWNWIGINWN